MTATAADTEMWIRRFHRSPEAAVRLIGFPHAGASASYFFPMSRLLAPRIECGFVQYPGRQDRRLDDRIEDLHLMADHITAALAPLCDLPLALFGHSMGATLAFEVARRLEATASRPAILFASGRRSPTRHVDERVHLLDDAGLIGELRRLSGTDARLLTDDELLELILPAIRSDYKAIERYRLTPGAMISCPVVAFVGDVDPRTSVADAQAWAEITTGGFDCRIFPGGHFYLADRQRDVINAITDALLPLLTSESAG
jgi:pyochelin biosynthesis protein PchC